MATTCLEHITQYVSLSEQEKQDCAAYLNNARKIKRKQLLLLQGDPFPYIVFVEKGMMRSFRTDEKGQEHIIQFAPEGSWIPDNFDVDTGQPSLVTIDAVEHSEIMIIEKEAYEQLLVKVPQLERYFRIVMQQRLNAMYLRVINYLSHMTEDKYKMFRDIYPDIVQRVPQHMIASYLGVQPETLSRNRKQMSVRKPAKENEA